MSKQLSLFSFAKKDQHREQEPSVAASSSSTAPPSTPTQLPNPTPPVCIPSSPTHHVAPTATACSLISRPKLVSYPKNKDNRLFNRDWYNGREWLEYIEEEDFCLCFPCKVFHSTTSTPFTKTGYRNWKMALSKKSGFMKHASSENHQSAMAQWKEQQHRDSSDTAISTLLNKPDPEHRTWLFTVFSVVKFLVMNGLPLREDSEMTNFKGEISGGLFLNTFGQLLFKLDPELDAPRGSEAAS